MSDPARPYEPLTSENASLVLYRPPGRPHHRGSRLFNGRAETQRGGAGQSGQSFEVAVVVTTTARDSLCSPTFPELVEALPGVPIIDRSSVNALDDPKVAQAIAATGRKS